MNTVIIISIFAKVDESVGSYNITFSDSKTGKTCGCVVIPVSLCADRVCSHMFDVLSSSLCSNSTDINVTVSADSHDHPMTNPIKIGLLHMH